MENGKIDVHLENIIEDIPDLPEDLQQRITSFIEKIRARRAALEPEREVV